MAAPLVGMLLALGLLALARRLRRRYYERSLEDYRRAVEAREAGIRAGLAQRRERLKQLRAENQRKAAH